jgi:prepilin-type N-terminal cleavage/methylation domain-containing protein
MPAYARQRRPALTLIEMLLALSVLSIMAVALGSLAMSVETSNDYITAQGEAAQHARVILTRIERTLNEAHASEDFPGFAVFAENVNGWQFPDTLVIWHPENAAVQPDDGPLFSELIVICPDPEQPWRLLEIRTPTDNRPAPPLSDSATWQTELAAIKKSATAERVQLTDLLRVGAITSGGIAGNARGAVFFHVRVLPSVTQWEQYKAGNVDWEDLPWAQSVHGSRTGLRQSWCAIELQLLPRHGNEHFDLTGDQVIPFFGSAAIYYELSR